MHLQSKRLKVTAVLDPAVVASVQVPNGVPRITLTIHAAGQQYMAALNAKSLRRCIAAINAAGPAGVTVAVQGKLDGSVIMEAGIVAQQKAPKAEVAA